jgi:hypothetical protein
MSLDNRAQVDAATLAEIETAVGRQRSLQEVVRDAFARGQTISEVIVQDEFTHDVVVPWRDLYLVYDTT